MNRANSLKSLELSSRQMKKTLSIGLLLLSLLVSKVQAQVVISGGTNSVAGGGTGLTSLTAHGVLIGEGTSPVVVVAGGTGCALNWTASSSDPTCATVPVLSGIKPSSDSTTAIQFQNAAGVGQLTIDTSRATGPFIGINSTGAAGNDLLDITGSQNTSQGIRVANNTGTAAIARLQLISGTTNLGSFALSQDFVTTGRFVVGHGLVDTNYLDVSSSGNNPIDLWSNNSKIGSVSSTVLNLIANQQLQYNGNSPATSTVGPSSPTGTTSTTLVMAGLAGSITTRTGRVVFCMSGVLSDGTANDGSKAQISYGINTAPTNGAALTGTQVGPIQQYNATSLAAGATAPYGACWTVTGLTKGTAYWYDTAFAAITGGTATLTQASMTAFDIP